MHVTCESCLREFQAPFAPCPDGRVGCCVAHYNEASWVCPQCTHDNGPAVARAFREGPHTMEIGMGVANIASVAKPELYSGVPDPDDIVVTIEELVPVSRPLKQPNNIRLIPGTKNYTSSPNDPETEDR